MPSVWQYFRSLFARVGSDPYYASFDRSLGNIKSEVERLQVGAGVRCMAYAANAPPALRELLFGLIARVQEYGSQPGHWPLATHQAGMCQWHRNQP